MTLHRARVLMTAALAAAGLLLASCSSSGSPTTAGAPAAIAVDSVTSSSAAAPTAQDSRTTPTSGHGSPSACTLVTEQELTTLLGADPGPGTDSSADTTSSCAYTKGVAVTIVVDSSGGRGQFDMLCGTDQAQPTIQKVSGVGDGACLTIVGGGPIAAMYILAGSDLVSINIQGGLDTKITPAALTAVGKAADGRL